MYTHPVAETKFPSSENGSFANGSANGVQLLNIKNLENQSKTGSVLTENSGSSLVSGQNGEVVPVKKVD